MAHPMLPSSIPGPLSASFLYFLTLKASHVSKHEMKLWV
jgi:hypothetical protein